MAGTTTIDLKTLIVQQAQAQGVPPEIALGVAQTESGIAQWTPNGNVVTSNKGAIGVFQLLPSTAAGLGVDPTDLTGNIAGGIAYLKQLYQQFGNWSDALAAYNWGPGNVSSKDSIPSSVMGYVDKVLGSAAKWAASLFGVGGSAAAMPLPGPAGSSPALSLPGAPDLTAGDLAGAVQYPLSPGIVAAGAIAAVAGVLYVIRRR